MTLPTPDPPTLGEELRKTRKQHGFTLKDVEKETGISNAYLSQLETGKIDRPAPDKLYQLAQMYRINFNDLMVKAGHIRKRSDLPEDHPQLVGTALSAEKLTPEEEKALLMYLKHILRNPDRNGG
ncbi:helix-turn-helix domain-containing protein [Deinococcus cellulosilyticus]|uniref:HTH cro/C1-type domain-containing protein n=1 Tax=Deinococcus cellulosilyticus (strain DSM 18568 / NBRC 106333 / KACC 11606 / 5516J-15) TaxID=1223518 RepID=A0A511NB38_DEIC1|nr:helix-turn-helix transcriptional regulator [Deinococcus cellulosilyticus]GEM50039.1 hypothetical protein DC3_56740 [Deinococcus cellulosilyticus NBRC 106333 = KACC 11606]